MSRTESQFSLIGDDGTTRTYTLLSAVTPDDLVRVAMKAYIFEKRTGETYESPCSREVRDQLVSTRITQRG
jgi:hypothetical protein